MEHQQPLPFLRARRGTISRIARELGISTQAISQWERVPAEHVLTVARLTEMSPRELRPDLYPDTIDWRGGQQP